MNAAFESLKTSFNRIRTFYQPQTFKQYIATLDSWILLFVFCLWAFQNRLVILFFFWPAPSHLPVVKGVLGCASVPYKGYGVFLSGKGIGWVLLWLHLHMIAVKLDRRQGEALTNWHIKCIFPVCVETIIRGTLNLHELMNNHQSEHMELKVWIKWKLIKMFTLWCFGHFWPIFFFTSSESYKIC